MNLKTRLDDVRAEYLRRLSPTDDASLLAQLEQHITARMGKMLRPQLLLLAAETTLTLANECPNIIGIKEASGNIQQAMEILRQRPAGFRVISGDDALTYPLLALGADGVISVVANALPKEMSDMVRLAMKGDLKKALPLQMKMLPIMNAIFDEGNPTGIKALLEIQGSITNILRLPLVKASKPLANKLSTLYNDFKNQA